MNIRQHIEAGHYEKNEDGQVVVPAVNEGYGGVVVAATNAPGNWPIVGWPADRAVTPPTVFKFDEDGVNGDGCRDMRLLPPPPRKVEVTARIEVPEVGHYALRYLARKDGGHFPRGVTIELTGSYEEW